MGTQEIKQTHGAGPAQPEADSTDAAPREVLLLASMAPDPHNPRRIESEAAAGLAFSLEKFGDLGMVFNLRTGQWVSGHQRVEQLKAAGATQVERDGDRGWIVHPKTGERFAVRLVDWDMEMQRKANLAANNPHIAGEFTDEALVQLRELQGSPDFEALQFDGLLDELEPSVPSGEADDQSGDLGESFQIVVTCQDEAQQIELLERFGAEGLKCRALI